MSPSPISFRLARRSLLVLALLGAACSSSEAEDEGAARTGDEQDIVYGKDDRYDVYAHPNTALRALAQNSVVALVKSTDITQNADESISLKSERLGNREVFYRDYEGLKLCSTERFLNDPTAAFCSGTLIADDLVLTAGHCFEDRDTCSTTSFVFGYYNDAADTLHPITSSDVFTCKEVIAQRYDRISKQEGADTPYQPNLDYTIVRIDRSAAPRFTPARVRTAVEALPEHQGLAVIGFGNGQPAKIDAGGKVVANNAERLDYFDASLDASWGNSGSGVFDLATLDLVGIHVRGQGDNFEAKGDCAVVKVCPERGCEDGKVKSITYSHGAVNRLCDTEPQAALCADHKLPARVAYTFGARRPLAGAPLAGPDGRVLVVDADGTLHGLDAQGKQAWEQPGKLRYNSPPAFSKTGDVIVTRTDSSIAALAADGSERWSFQATSGISQPAVVGAEGQVYFLSSDGTLVALDDAGQTSWVWKGDWQYPSAISVSPTDGDLLVSAGKVLYRLQKTGELRAKTDIPSNVKRGIAFASDGSAIFTGDAGGLVRVAADGALVFALDTPELKNLGPISVVGETILTSRNDTLVAKSLVDGADLWSFAAKNTIRSAAVAMSVGGEPALCFGAMDGLIYTLRPDGSLLATIRTEGGIEATAAVDAKGHAFINSLDGRLYALASELALEASRALDWGMAHVRGNGAAARRGLLWGAVVSAVILTLSACEADEGDGGGSSLGPGSGAAGSSGQVGGASGSGDLAVGAAPHTGETDSREAFLTAYSGVVCAMFAPCCAATPSGFDQGGCERWVGKVQGAFWSGDFHPDIAASCLASLRNALSDTDRCRTTAYDDATLEPLCASAFTPPSNGGLPAGSACTSDEACDPPPRGTVDCAKGFCRALVPTQDEGASPCGPSPAVSTPLGTVYECDRQAGLWCDRSANDGAGACRKQVGDGALCPFSNACDAANMCVGGVCRALPGDGQACLNAVPGAGGFCAPGASCDPNTLICVAASVGENDAGRPCNTDLDCISRRCEGKKCVAYDFSMHINCGK